MRDEDLQQRAVGADSEASPSAMFTPSPAPERGFSPAVWGVAALVVLCVVGGLLFASRRHSGAAVNTPLPPAPYASSLSLTGVQMSESTSLSGGKSTYIDGHIHNTGSQTVTGATAQVFFRNSEGMPPGIETLPISLIRTREPYVDTQPISASPLKPGDDREFRLIFETLPGNWNMELPEIRIVRVTSQ